MTAKRPGYWFKVFTACTVLSAASVLPAWAVDFNSVVTLDIPAQKLSFALVALGRQTGVQVMTDAADLAETPTPGVHGKLSLAAALEQLLAGSNLQYEQAGPNSIVVRRSARDRASDDRAPAVAPRSDGIEGAESGSEKLEAVTVTGTRIKGGVSTSPLILIDTQQIREAGQSDLGEVIRSLPQNFTGGQNPGVMSAIGAGVANQNITAGAALNLRGLGPDATLTLLNGRRISYDGFAQAVDISAIPLAALERIEIVSDGASAIYGSDAVAGVANVILKRDFEGVTLSGRIAGATDGGMDTRHYSATGGTSWNGGGFIAAYEHRSADPVLADQRSYTRYMPDPSTLYPQIEQDNALLSVHQSLGTQVTLSIDALHAKRDSYIVSTRPTLMYALAPETKITTVAPTLEVLLPRNWTMSFGGSYGRDENTVVTDITAPSGAPLLHSTGHYDNDTRVFELGAEGPLVSLPAGDVRLALGAGQRREEFSTTGIDGERQSYYLYSELSVPLHARLNATAALRYEDYDNFGNVTTPKVGLSYRATADLMLKASWGRSFKAPTLTQQYQTRDVYLYPAASMGASGGGPDDTALLSIGGDPDLDPERAKTWTVSTVWQPQTLSGLEVELGYFNIDYTGRVAQPVTNTTAALRDPIYTEFLEPSPSTQRQSELIGGAPDGLTNYSSGSYDPSRVVAIVNDTYINVAQQRIRGVDLTGSYRFDVFGGRATLRGSSTWLRSTQRNSAQQPEFDLAGNIYNPPKSHVRTGAAWNRAGFTLSSFVNYLGRVSNAATTAPPPRFGSLTTVDLAASYVTPDTGPLSQLELSLAVQNLFDRAPPTYTPPYSYMGNFDSTNYSPVGRLLGLSVSKHW
ncbi:MAG: TonB-dependent receptor [Gammaproteobacteria bacterium]